MDNDLKSIYLELGSKLDKIDCLMLDDIANQIVQADKVYCYGCGRSGMSLQTFSMRIMHLGKKSYYVHDTCVPPIGENDLLIAASGFRVIIVTVANSLGNIRVFELLPKLKTKKYGWCIA